MRAHKLSVGIVVFSLAFTSLVFAQKKSTATSGTAVFMEDHGKLAIQLNGQTVGHEQFEITPVAANWTARSTTDIKSPATSATRVTGTLTLQSDGAPVAYEWTSKTEKTNGAHILFSNGVAKITLEMQGARPFEQDLTFGTPRIAVLDDNLYYQYAILARLYDWSKRGTQNLPVIIPQELTPGSISVEPAGPTVAGDGKSYDALRVSTSDLQVILFLDSNHRLMRLEVASAKVTVARE